MKYLLLLFWLAPLFAHPQCKSLSKKTDKFEQKVTISTPLIEPVFIRKEISKDTVYYLGLNAPAIASTDRKGVIIILSDGGRLEWPEETVEVNLRGALYHWGTNLNANAFIRLTPDQVALLSKQAIKDYRLYIFDHSLKGRKAADFRDEINCLRSIDPAALKEQ